MSKTLEQLRADLARNVSMFFTGAATGGGVNTLIDTDDFQIFTEADALVGALAYILTAGGAAPEGEARRITDYNQTTQTCTVDPDYSAAVQATDVYELYRAPLSLAQWNKAVNEAISGAWPEVWSTEVENQITHGRDEYVLPSTAEGVLEAAVRMLGSLDGYPLETLPRTWRVSGTPGTDLRLSLTHAVPPGSELRILYKANYPELAAAESTDLDYPYIMLAAQARVYDMLAAESGTGAASGRYLQLMDYFTKEAKDRKAALNAALLGIEGVVPQKRGS